MKTWIWLGIFVAVAFALYLTVGGSDDSSAGSTTDNDDDGQDAATDEGDSTVRNQTFLERWAHAIAPAENVNPAYNNPGGLNMAGDLGSTPAAGGTGHDVIGIFSSLQKGYAALETILGHYVAKYPDKTLLEATAIYQLGPGNSAVISGMQTGIFPQSVITEATVWAKGLGVSINDTLGSIASR